MSSFLASVSFLTRLKFTATQPDREALIYSIIWFPFVGGLTGLGLGFIFRYGFASIWPDSVGVGVLLLFLVWLKDAFHLDGLSDLVDGLYGGSNPSEIQTVMKDSNLGPFGAVAIIFSLALEYVVLINLPSGEILYVLPLVLGVSTGAAGLVLCWGQRMVGSDGLGAFFIRGRRPWFGSFLMVVMMGIGYLCLSWTGLAISLVAIAVSYGLNRFYQFKLDGVNGDCCGATVMIIQVLLLLGINSLFYLELARISRPYPIPW